MKHLNQSLVLHMLIVSQIKKILEVYEQAKQRMGVVIVGPPQTGKSTVCAILKKVCLKKEENS